MSLERKDLMIENDIRGHGFEYYFNEQLEFKRLKNQEMYFKSLSGMRVDETRIQNAVE